MAAKVTTGDLQDGSATLRWLFWSTESLCKMSCFYHEMHNSLNNLNRPAELTRRRHRVLRRVPEDAESLIGKVNNIVKARLLKLNVKTYRTSENLEDTDAEVIVDDEHIEVVEHFKYLGSLKSADGNWSRDTRSRIGMAKKIRLDLVPIWRDREMNKDLTMWTVLTYGAECWTLTKADEKRIESAELWI